MESDAHSATHVRAQAQSMHGADSKRTHTTPAARLRLAEQLRITYGRMRKRFRARIRLFVPHGDRTSTMTRHRSRGMLQASLALPCMHTRL